MKKNLLIFLGIPVLALVITGTLKDPFIESYMAAMRRQTGAAQTESHAEERRALQQVCDADHACLNVSEAIPVEEQRRRDIEMVMPYVYSPVWLCEISKMLKR